MQVEGGPIDGVLVVTPTVHTDRRGSFCEWLRPDLLGRPVPVAQANHSVSRRGTVRGVHVSAVPPGQAKYVYCPRGRVLDVVVDLRVGSPTFGRHTSVLLDDATRRAVWLDIGLGHAFAALSDLADVVYLCSTGYDPATERGVHPLDPDLALPWPAGQPPVLSERDASAPGLAEALAAGLLPDYRDCLRHSGR